jgi:hypothetical protein
MSWGYPIYHQCDFGIFHEIKTIQLLGYPHGYGNPHISSFSLLKTQYLVMFPHLPYSTSKSLGPWTWLSFGLLYPFVSGGFISHLLDVWQKIWKDDFNYVMDKWINGIWSSIPFMYNMNHIMGWRTIFHLSIYHGEDGTCLVRWSGKWDLQVQSSFDVRSPKSYGVFSSDGHGIEQNMAID